MESVERYKTVQHSQADDSVLAPLLVSWSPLRASASCRARCSSIETLNACEIEEKML